LYPRITEFDKRASSYYPSLSDRSKAETENSSLDNQSPVSGAKDEDDDNISVEELNLEEIDKR
jgi:hypothetical protein